MEYHEKKYLIDSLNYNFQHYFEESNRVILNRDNEVVEPSDVLNYLNEEFELESNKSLNILFRWLNGDLYAEYIERSSDNDFQ